MPPSQPDQPDPETNATAGRLSREQHEFLGALVHELRNPLSAIATALQLMRETEGADVVLRERGVIERQVANLTRVLDDLRDMARLGRGNFELRREPSDLVSITKRALENVTPFAERRGHKLEVALTEDVLPVEADVARVAQVIYTLVANAVKYTPSAGRITLDVRGEDGCGVVRVRDTGVGIGAELLPHVLDLAPIGSHHADRSHGGLAIGLALGRRLIDLHGGSLTADSAGRDRGSEFTLRLPLAPIPR